MILAQAVRAFGADLAVPADTFVWTILISGDFEAASCGPTGPPAKPCGSAAPMHRIIIDYYSGTFIESTVQ